MPTPLYDALKNYAASCPARYHMPGHKGKFFPIPELLSLAPLDVTELPATGNLYTAGAPFDRIAGQLLDGGQGFTPAANDSP